VRNEERVALKNVVPDEGEYGQGVASEKIEYSHDLIAEEALRFVEEHAHQPFFLYFALTPPHANNQAGDAGMEVPDLGIYADKDWPEAQKGTAAMISLVDRDVGRLMTLLKEQGIDGNTLVFFTSDNGPHAEGGNDPEFFDSNGQLRGIKRDLYEGGIRVPMLVRWPGKAPAGSISNHVGYFGDLMATAAEVARVPVPSNLDSVSFLPAILGEIDRQEEHAYLYWEFYERGSAQAIRMGNWKAVRKPMFGDTIELYNLESDTGEEIDVSEGFPEVVAKARQLMEEAHTSAPLWKIRD
jgi:arylsulfatase A-like enzyme